MTEKRLMEILWRVDNELYWVAVRAELKYKRKLREILGGSLQ